MNDCYGNRKPLIDNVGSHMCNDMRGNAGIHTHKDTINYDINLFTKAASNVNKTKSLT